MRLQLTAAALAGVVALATAGGLPRTHGPAAGRCDPPAASLNGKYVTPSSLAPRERAYKNQYGAPIPPPIVTKRAPHKPKAQPQLHSSPLPAS